MNVTGLLFQMFFSIVMVYNFMCICISGHMYFDMNKSAL